jgi:hypothetical protein
MVSFEADILIGCSVIWVSLEGSVKTIIGTKPDLVFLYKHCTVFSDKLAMTTGMQCYKPASI